MLRRCISLLLPALLLCGCSLRFSLSREPTPSKTIPFPAEETSFSESDLYFNLQGLSRQELRQNYPSAQRKAIGKLNLEKALKKRAALSEETLSQYGYTEEEITLLKSYDGEELTADSAVLQAADATLSAAVTILDYTDGVITAEYAWVWDVPPLLLQEGTDTYSFSYKTLDEDAQEKISMLTEKTASADYYSLSDGTFHHQEPLEARRGEGCITAASPTQLEGDLWAKSGRITLTISRLDDGQNTFDNTIYSLLWTESRCTRDNGTLPVEVAMSQEILPIHPS